MKSPRLLLLFVLFSFASLSQVNAEVGNNNPTVSPESLTATSPPAAPMIPTPAMRTEPSRTSWWLVPWENIPWRLRAPPIRAVPGATHLVCPAHGAIVISGFCKIHLIATTPTYYHPTFYSVGFPDGRAMKLSVPSRGSGFRASGVRNRFKQPLNLSTMLPI